MTVTLPGINFILARPGRPGWTSAHSKARADLSVRYRQQWCLGSHGGVQPNGTSRSLRCEVCIVSCDRGRLTASWWIGYVMVVIMQATSIIRGWHDLSFNDSEEDKVAAEMVLRS